MSTAITKSEDDKPGKPESAPYLDLVGNLTAMAAAARSFSLAYICIYHLPAQWGLETYPAFGPAREWRLDWMMHIIVRNVVATLVICGFWDWFLYFSPLQSKVCREIFFFQSSEFFLEASQVQDESSLPEHETDQA